MRRELEQLDRAPSGETDGHAWIEDCARLPALERALLLGRMLARQSSTVGVWEALATHAAGVARGWAATCLIADGSGILHCTQAPADDRTRLPLSFPAMRSMQPLTMAAFGAPAAAELIQRDDARSSARSGGLELLFDDTRVQCAACITVGERGLLIVVERRSKHEFTPDDWYRLRAIADQADVALERIALEAELRRVQAP
jgi:GAF domain-containing protein